MDLRKLNEELNKILNENIFNEVSDELVDTVHKERELNFTNHKKGSVSKLRNNIKLMANREKRKNDTNNTVDNTQTLEDNEVYQILNNCYKNNSQITGKIKKAEYDYYDQGSWNFSIKVLVIKSNGIVKIAYRANKLTPSGYWDNGITETSNGTYEVTKFDTIEKFVESVIKDIQGQNYITKYVNY